jgi:hypothetical protein
MQQEPLQVNLRHVDVSPSAISVPYFQHILACLSCKLPARQVEAVVPDKIFGRIRWSLLAKKKNHPDFRVVLFSFRLAMKLS